MLLAVHQGKYHGTLSATCISKENDGLFFLEIIDLLQSFLHEVNQIKGQRLLIQTTLYDLLFQLNLI